MELITVDTTKGKLKRPVYDVYEDAKILDEFAFSSTVKAVRGKYLNIPCAFDIETTNIKDVERPFAYMYHWQFCIVDTVFFGRTWDEFTELLRQLRERLNLMPARKLVVYVHNLSFEFQFFRRFVTITDAFLKGNRNPLRITVNEVFEFRDSYALSNMRLEKFCENTPDVIFSKNEEFNYQKIRTPETKLSWREKSYCYCDVAGLCECIAHLMQEDNLAKIPFTSTGYVRRDFRSEYQTNKKLRYDWQLYRLTPETYQICRDAFRGGDTHANYDYVGRTINDVQSWDISSSYPAAMLLDRYPVTAFTEIRPQTWLKHNRMPEYAALIQVAYKNLEYIGDAGMPYISLSKCQIIGKKPKKVKGDPRRTNDNGRLLDCNCYTTMWITDIDLQIIEHEYKWSWRGIKRVFVSKYGQLPEEHKRQVMHYFRLKTQLKNVEGKEYEYGKAKNRLNAGYGMMVTRIAKDEWQYYAGDYHKESRDLSVVLDMFYKSRNNFLRYDQGLWVTANSRLRLRTLIWKVGKDVCYVDTDSIKCVHDHTADFEAYNKEIIKRCEERGYYADDPKGKRHYLGVFEYEGTYEEFKTLGAKRYITKKEGSSEYETTIAGVDKKKGAKFFNKKGLDAFRNGVVIPDAGHVVAYYNDDQIHTITVKGCQIRTASNVALIDDKYTMGLTGEYLDLLLKIADRKGIID